MQKLFQETLTLDYLAREKYDLSEDIMMENAASSIVQLIKSLVLQQLLPQKEGRKLKLMVFCGAGNNGADGYAVARMLQETVEVVTYEVFSVKTDLAKMQKSRAQKVGVTCVTMTEETFGEIVWDADIYLDAILGASQKGDLSTELRALIDQMNRVKGIKIACDLPTGIYSQSFKADFTVTMGALKTVLFQDFSKDFVGEIIVADLGISRDLYENETNIFLLEAQDLKLPFRSRHDSHKGSYGFVSVFKGEQSGASILSAKAAMCFGAGITALIGVGEKPIDIMQMSELSSKTTAVAVGMGLGCREVHLQELMPYPLVIDADLLGKREILSLLKDKEDCVITPHPQEFRQLLALAEMGDYSIAEVQSDRFGLAQRFSEIFKSVLVLKGANTIIAHRGVLYVSTLGKNHLAKGGSGDVLAGMIAALLAQGYSALEAAIHAVLAHAMASNQLNINDYAMTPLDLIEALKHLA